ncbi:NAD(P)/FAD-dependent oxidoreductase [Flexivirga sp. ID2601S]|uniref:NAD(P)/FAD-dependent oxidoreductase n=1 Tax=Flexivirga aerilata TaxID=1656889 RepID=A0A849ALW4_9MICO|nr:NAD(P)/FAD-dependent oxidoreductase [Flexivirga aerilata]NNG40777.1 NAD(P)/FAD-dependent oxidoreductase [Flexivirga aerilata]
MTNPEHFDVVIVGAGLSGIGAASTLRRDHPDKSLLILERRERMGGTWDLFRYPGVRSDSDMYTLGYRFRPWTDTKSLADGPSIRQYIVDTAREYGVDQLIRYQQQLLSADWSSRDQQWTLRLSTPEGERVVTCVFLYMCSGYYNYDEGYTPTFAGRDDFAGRIVHPQHWPEDLDVTGKKVVVIGSGATAVTLVPQLARDAERVTMLQRSPTYVAAVPSVDAIGDRLQRRKVPTRIAYPILRWKNVARGVGIYEFSRRQPQRMRALLDQGVARFFKGSDFDYRTHFRPSYDPWDQRLCAVPGGDLFKAIKRGTADVVTDTIDRFDETGILLGSGKHLDADVIVTATGLNLQLLGGAGLSVDGAEVEAPQHYVYKGMALSGVPNFVMTIGYTNASWTLKADLVAEYVSRLLRHLDKSGYAAFVPEVPAESARWKSEPLIDLQSGYVTRSVHLLPLQGEGWPWKLRQNYPYDLMKLRHGSLTDGVRFITRSTAKNPERELVSA